MGTQPAGDAELYLKDFDYFIEKLVETHPDPFTAFGSRVEFYRAKQEFRKNAGSISGHQEFVILLNQFISRLEDGHTYIRYDQEKKEKAETKQLPLRLKAAADKVFVANSTKEFKDVIGKPVLAVNHIPLKALLKKARTLYPAENSSGAYYNLIRLLRTRKSAKLLSGSGETLTFTFGAGGKKTDVRIPFQSQAGFLPETSRFETPEDNGLLYWKMTGKNKDIGYLAWHSTVSREVVGHSYRRNPGSAEHMLRWAYRFLKTPRSGDIEKDILQIPALYEQFYLLAREMKSKKSRVLIIDLRKNSGGMTPLVHPLLYLLYGGHYLDFHFGAQYIRRLSPLFLKKMGFKNIDELNKAWGGNFQTGDYQFSSFGDLGNHMTVSAKRERVLNGYFGFGAEVIKKMAAGSPFRPKIVLLTSPHTFSAAFHLTWFFKRLGRTRVLGVASRQAGNSFMETTPFLLPGTGLKGSISNAVQVLFPGNPEQGKMLMPDVEMTWEDYKHYSFDSHAEILKAIRLIEQGALTFPENK